MKTVYDIKSIFKNASVLIYCEDNGIYEVYSRKGNVIVYYSYFSGEGFYKIIKNVKTGKETRTILKYKTAPKFLLTSDGATKYNYCCG